ncbi:MAG: hypothetical protein ACR2QK_23295, partial [Acidimicrobiales bacterium]
MPSDLLPLHVEAIWFAELDVVVVGRSDDDEEVGSGGTVWPWSSTSVVVRRRQLNTDGFSRRLSSTAPGRNDAPRSG